MKYYRILTKLILVIISAALMYGVVHYGGYSAGTIPVINEICTDNFSVATTPDEEYLDYMELYNREDEDYTMDHLWLSDDRDDPFRYDMSGITVPAHGYAVIWMVDEEDAEGAPSTAVQIEVDASEQDEDATTLTCLQYYCPFDLSHGGAYLYICNEDSKILASVSVPALAYNVAYGCETDGVTTYTGMEPTPGASNDDAVRVELDKTDEPILTVESGFYEEPFELRIVHPARQIVYYTLDGSTPTTSSTRYDGPITIQDPTENPNVYSARDDIYLHNYVPEEPVDKAVVVRAIAVDRITGAVSDVVSATYFVGYEDREDYDGVAIVSLITDPDNLYDHDSGIYVMGATYDEYIEKGGFEELTSSLVPSSFSNSSGNHIRYLYTNAQHHGREWERKVTVQYYDANHELQLVQEAGVRIAGESSRHQVHKSMNLIARRIYGNSEWAYPFWGYEGSDTVRLRSSGGEAVNYKETFIQSLADGRSIGIQHSIPCAVFMDGEYWGMYQLTEQYDAAYFAQYYGVNSDEITVYKNHSIIEGDEEQGMSDYEDLEEIITTYDMSVDHLYALAEERVDMTSLIDYFATLTYMSNTDIAKHHNQELWHGNAEDGDRRWKYVIYDLDQTAGDPAYNTIQAYHENYDTFYWPMYLCANPAFKERYVTTMMDLANVEYSYHRVHNRLMAKADDLENQAIESKRRYVRGDYNAEDYAADVEALDDFFRLRRKYIEQYLKEDLGLSDLATVTVTNSDFHAGAVRVNSSVLTAEDYSYDENAAEGVWSGDYFTDYNVTLTAAPLDGYTFAGWTGDVESSESTITVPLDTGALNIRAVFVPAR